MIGRPKVITEEMKAEILRVVEIGLSRRDAAAYVGLKSEATIRDEMGRDEDFSRTLKRAELDGKLYHITRVKAGPQNWQSSAWWLERKYTQEFGRIVREDTKKPPEPVKQPMYAIKERLKGDNGNGNGKGNGSKTT